MGRFGSIPTIVQNAIAQTGTPEGEAESSALGDIIVSALQELLRILFRPVTRVIEKNANSLIEIVVGTPHPNAVFTRPTNGVWVNLYDYYWETMVPLVLTLWALSIGLVIFLESTSYLFSNYHRSKLKKRAFAGLLGILSWWWIAALSLQFVHGLTGFLVPNLAEISLFETLSFSSMGVLGLVVSLAADFVLFVLIALIYFTRQIALYLFVLLMPLLIVFWIPGVGPFTLASRFMKRLAGFFVPFLFMTVPVALLFRLGGILGSSFELSMGGIGLWLTALVIPIMAVLSPLVLFWQAGALFVMAERTSHHMSSRQARTRVQAAQQRGSEASHGSRNFIRGVRGKPAIRRDGQTLLNSGGSRAHSLGDRLTPASTQTTRSYRTDGGGHTKSDSRNANFEHLETRLRPGRRDRPSHSSDGEASNDDHSEDPQ
ncbi:hypothetical protein ACFQH3_16735 [Haladaptatus sp. GCM10025707]|uniref:hypothetical protein n=1 Tax=unclassified Haladaptatus TaxID=2622732 RepID=UPI0023E88B36|nr:hypothetical protein [Haladaptatus sp. QDMS2]